MLFANMLNSYALHQLCLALQAGALSVEDYLSVILSAPQGVVVEE